MNADEIVGFADQCIESVLPSARFDLVEELQRAREMELARLAGIAERLAQSFGPDIAAGFLCCEILGHVPAASGSTAYGARLRRVPSSAAEIATELAALVNREPPPDIAPANDPSHSRAGNGADLDTPAGRPFSDHTG